MYIFIHAHRQELRAVWCVPEGRGEKCVARLSPKRMAICPNLRLYLLEIRRFLQTSVSASPTDRSVEPSGEYSPLSPSGKQCSPLPKRRSSDLDEPVFA